MRTHSDNLAERMLVLRCQAGDKAAFDELLRSIQTRLWRYISKLTGDTVLAEDLLQEVFLIIYRKIGWLNDPNLFRPWVYRIASREAFRMMKKQRGRREESEHETLVEVSMEPNPEQDRELLEQLPEMLASVSPASRAVLGLHYLEELSLSETAAVLDISIGTAKSRLAYGLITLRRRIKEVNK